MRSRARQCELARRDWRPPPLVLAIVATIVAAGLVFYLQQRAMTALQSQNEVIVRQLAEQTAADIAVELRRTLARADLRHPGGREPPRAAGRPARPGGAAVRQGTRRLPARRSVLRLDAGSDRVGRTSPTCCSTGGAASSAATPISARRCSTWPRQHAGTQQIYIAAEGIGAEPAPGVPAAVLGRRPAPRVLRGARLRDRAGEHAQRLFAGPHGRAFDAVLLRRGARRPAAAARHRRDRRRRLRHAARRRRRPG